jgi:CRP-like cAMP-binding protein
VVAIIKLPRVKDAHFTPNYLKMGFVVLDNGGRIAFETGTTLMPFLASSEAGLHSNFNKSLIFGSAWYRLMCEPDMAYSDALDFVFARRGWLSRQSPVSRRFVLERGRRVAFDPGDHIVRMGDDAGGIYGIISGGVGTIGMTDLTGPALGHIMREGSWFGQGPLLTKGPRSMTFRSMEESELFLVPLQALKPLMAADAGFAEMIAQMTEYGSRMSETAVRELLIRDAPRRLAATLLRVTAVLDGVVSASAHGFRINQTDLAEMACVSRNYTNRILSELQARGLVTLSYNHIQIERPDALAAYVREGD